jgi:hypothetical protein
MGIAYRKRILQHQETAIPLAIVILPLTFVLVARLIQALPGRALQIAFAAMVFAGSLHHAMTFEGIAGIEPIRRLETHVADKDQGWRRVGVVLEEAFTTSTQPVVIATTAAGAIPYFSGLRTVDMHGLNDRWIARHAPVVSVRPGHQREPTLEYLVEQGVNLVLGHPQVDPVDVVQYASYGIDDLARFRIHGARAELLPSGACVIEIPLNAEYKLTALYLRRHPDIDRVIRERRLATIDIRRVERP